MSPLANSASCSSIRCEHGGQSRTDCQDEILDWVNRVIISGSTDYRAFQAAVIKSRYAVRFRAFQGKGFPKKQSAAAGRIAIVATHSEAPEHAPG